MTTPQPLKPGDTIAIVSTARKILKEEVIFAIHTFESWGFKVELGQHLFEVDNQFAGTDEQRAQDLQKALDNPSVKAIVCARGGYGTVRIIDRIDFSSFINSPKWICGYSDITALHAHIQQNFGIETLHSTMPINFETNTNEALLSLHKALINDSIEYEFDAAGLNRIGTCSGEVVGGNLSMIYSLLGSKSAIGTTGKILFLEDLDEYLYHIDRMMMNLKRNGLLDNLAGVIIGGMTDMNDNITLFGKSAHEIISEHLSDYNYPICFDFPAGHIDDNRTLILGRKATLSVTTEFSKLSFNRA